ncbi:MAG: hypothetical protein MI742_07935 [Desulfobacterales bacterium]|nr:hypothetical protein [Desulfobacterales bacterium]
MSKRSYAKSRVIAAVVFVVALFLSFPAYAGFFGFWNGQVAKPGSEYYEVGTSALMMEKGAGYFTNGKGRIIEVRAKRDSTGDLRVSVSRVYIPPNYIGESFHQKQKIAAVQEALQHHVLQSPWLGEYVKLSGKLAEDAWMVGKLIEREIRKSSRTNAK